MLLQNKALSLQRNSKKTKQPLAVSHWPLAKQRNTNQKQNIKHNAEIKSAQPSNMTYKNKASDKTRSRRQIAADFQVRGNKREEEMASVKTRNGNVSEDLKVHRYSCPRLYRRTNCRTDSYSTGLKTRGYLTPRLPDD